MSSTRRAPFTFRNYNLRSIYHLYKYASLLHVSPALSFIALLPCYYLVKRTVYEDFGCEEELKTYEDENRRIVSSEMLRRVALVRTEVSEERSASIIRMTRIGELVTTLACVGC
jgi:hypothetical protein